MDSLSRWSEEKSPADLAVEGFFRLPCALRIAVWMLGAWLCALPFHWVVSNYSVESCFALLRGYAFCGAISYFLHLAGAFLKPLTHRLTRFSLGNAGRTR